MEVPVRVFAVAFLSSFHRVWLIKGVFHKLVKISKLMSAVRLSSLAVKPTTTSDSTESERALRDVQERIAALEAGADVARQKRSKGHDGIQKTTKKMLSTRANVCNNVVRKFAGQ